MRRQVFDFRRVNLVLRKFRRFARMSLDVLLQHERVCVLFMTHGALMEHSHGRLGSMYAHVRLQVALRSEGSTADATLKRPFAGVRSVVHLQGRFARQNAMANDALVGIRQLVLDIVHQLLKLRSLVFLAYFDERFPSVVVTTRTRQQIGVNIRVLRWIDVRRKDAG